MLENHINSLLSHPFLITLPPLFLLLFLIKCLSSSAAAGGRRPPPSPPFKLPVIGHLHKLGTYPHRSLRAMSRQHGPLMSLRLGSVPAVVASSAAAAREILKTHDLTFASRPKLEINRKLLYNYKDVVTAPYGEFWRQMKSVMVVHLLSNKRVESIRAIREQETEQFASKIAESSGSAVDLSELFMSLTNDVVSRAAVGRKYNDGESGKKFRKLMRELMGLLGGFDIGAFIPSLSWVNRLNGLDAAVERVAAEIDEFLEGVVEERLRLREKKDEEREDFMDVLLGIYEDKNLIKLSIDRESVKALILDIFSGGTDTTYTVLEWAMTELLRNPRTMKKLQNEVRNTVRDKPNIIDEDLEKLPYLKAVIKETLRLHPPIPLLIPREASHDVKVMGYDITKGTLIIINAWAIGMDPSSWDEPDEFKPERFLNSPIDIRGHDFELIPFGAGRRGCPGITFAMSTDELVLATLVRKFDWELPRGVKGEDLDMSECTGVAIHRKVPLVAVAIPCS